MHPIFKNKKILFIAPTFFGYDRRILEQLQKFGAEVTFFDEKPIGLVYRFLKNVSNKLFLMYLKYYEKSILKKIRKKRFDFFLLIRGEHISNELLIEIMVLNPNVKKIMYQWDSLKNNPNALKIINYFDSVKSFDHKDCEEINEIKYLPLFYVPGYRAIRDSESLLYYDVIFVGSFTKKRLQQIEEFERFFQLNGIKFSCFLYFPLLEFAKFYFKTRVYSEKFVFKKLTEKQMLKIVKGTRAVLDLPSPTQTGTTMRSIETLAANRKLLTTNINIDTEKFYLSTDIKIIRELLGDEIFNFIHSKSNIDLSKLLSLELWLVGLFSLKLSS